MAKRVKVSRKELFKEEDQFLSTSHKITAYMSDHGPMMLTSAGIIIVLFALVAGYNYNQQVKDMRMENLYFQMVEIIKKEPVNKEKPEQKPENAIGELEKLFGQFQEGSQKTRAGLLLAEEYYQDEKYDKAIAIYTQISDRSGEKELSLQLAKIGMAYSYEGKKDYAKAAEMYKSIVGNATGYPLFDMYVGLARCYELNNDNKNALTTLREMENKFQSHPQIDSVKRRITKLSGSA